MYGTINNIIGGVAASVDFNNEGTTVLVGTDQAGIKKFDYNSVDKIWVKDDIFGDFKVGGTSTSFQYVELNSVIDKVLSSNPYLSYINPNNGVTQKGAIQIIDL